MLTRLKITNFLLIEQLELDFYSGLTVLTGETGSGKSIIIDALMLLFGARVPKDIIRNPHNPATFEAEFNLSNINTLNWLKENDLIDFDNPHNIICRRVIDSTGKSKVYINGNSVTISQIKILSDFVLDIHTQHASITLLKPDIQRNLLDEYAQISPQVQQLSSIFKQLITAEQKLNHALSESHEIKLKRQILLATINELSELKLVDGEWEELEIRHKMLTNAGVILADLDYALNLLNSDSIIANINKLQSRLSKTVQQIPKLEKMVELLNSIEIELDELVHGITNIAASVEQDPNSLQALEERINQIFALSRKYRISPEQINDNIKKWQDELNLLDSESDIEAINTTLNQLKSDYQNLAKIISQARNKSAIELSDKVTEFLHKLALNGKFVITLSALSEFTNFGFETIEYQIGFNKGMAIQSLAKAASGGELSRTALALYLLLSIHNPPEIIIFDEIDVGIGGKIAAIVGEMLATLGLNKQVICITHQPQTAVYGNKHLVVSKEHSNEISKAQIKYIKNDERINEIARMLGGVEITSTTLSHAKELLASINQTKNSLR